MSPSHTSHQITVSRPKITLLMILGGVLSASAAGAVSAATPGDDVPRIVIRFSPDELASQDGARHLYHRLVEAAANVCPDVSTGSRFPSPATQHCRAQSVARAVWEINNPRLAEVFANSTRRG